MRFTAFEKWAAHTGLDATVDAEDQSSDYESGLACVGGESWHIRTARITPTKSGGFVAFWKRGGEGQTEPFGNADVSNGLLVFVEEDGRRGLFRFTRGDLAELGITRGDAPGKRGFRVYPDWCTGLNKQARASQNAQSASFQRY